MENVFVDVTPSGIATNANEQTTESSEQFQKFIYELFEENGILNDLRAYLRGHIVNVLKSARTGDPLPCQKHFTQRLELTYQALNILIAEYLLRLEFSYSLSVFVSEIPLANMVFEFAKTLMLNADGDHGNLKFKDSDVWCILNYLGVKCDSQHASSIVEMYRSEETAPLLLCILKCMPMYNRDAVIDPVNSSEGSVTSSVKSSDSHDERHAKYAYKNTSFHDKCRQYVHCKMCQNKISRVKEKYTKKKKNFEKNTRESNLNQMNVENLLRNIGVMERSLIDEMFQQLKTVYEAELEMVKSEEDNRVKKSFASHVVQLQKRRDEMEGSFKAREEELERNVQQKKKFLWGLARALRDQHAHMMRAMHDVKVETKRLSDKEDSLKTQIADAEQLLRRRGEEMRTQISNELSILESHLESMKRERDSINRERNELEQLKNITESNSKLLKVHNLDSEEVKNHYELLKNELNILKKYIEATKLQPKCVKERSTLTDVYDVSSRLNVTLNNSHEVSLKGEEDKLKYQVVNELKKPKNVNFSQSNLDEIYRERSRERSRSSASSEAGDANSARFEEQAVRHLNDENERLKTFARQQRDHIDELLSQQARLQAELTATRFRAAAESTPTWRPRTAPTVMPRQAHVVERLNSSASADPMSHGWRKGAGEELSLFSNAQPRILVPGDVLPFIGVIADGHTDYRRHLVNQWRTLRRRVSPLTVASRAKNRSPAQRDVDVERGETSGNIGLDPVAPVQNQEDATYIQKEGRETQDQLSETCTSRPLDRPNPAATTAKKNRERSPKSVLREAKQKLKNKDTTKERPHHSREKSPNTVLKEAKLRLRKLEIEAEAVEQSYMEFRKRQSLLKENRSNVLHATESVTKDVVGQIDASQNKLIEKPQHIFEIPSQSRNIQQLTKIDVEKYLKSYQTIDLCETHFKNRNTTAVKIKPIPESHRNIDNVNENKNYLETPLTEFRKLYNSAKRPVKIDGKNIDNRIKIDDANADDRVRIDERNVARQDNRPLSPIIGVESDVSDNSVHSRKDALRMAKNNKKAELEILKQNINKIYNLKESAIDKSVDNCVKTPISQPSDSELGSKSNASNLESNITTKNVSLNKKSIKIHTKTPQPHSDEGELRPESNQIKLESRINENKDSSKSINRNILKDIKVINAADETKNEVIPNNNRVAKTHSDVDEIPQANIKVIDTDDEINDEVATFSSVDSRDAKMHSDVDEIPLANIKVTDIDDEIKDEVTPVNSIDNRDAKTDLDVDEIPPITIIISPKDQRSRRSVSPEQAAKLTRNDVLDAIFHNEGNDQSSTQMHLELSNDVLEDSGSDFDKGDAYRDDFSADVDNYNSRSEFENYVGSPVSVAKTSDDENFWES